MTTTTVALGNQKAGTGLIVAGYVFALLGGLIGVALGCQLHLGKVTDPSGAKVLQYDAASRSHGMIIMCLSVLSMIVWGVVNATMNR